MNCTYLDAATESCASMRPAYGTKLARSIHRSAIVPCLSKCGDADFLNQMLYLDYQDFHGQPKPELQR